MRSLTVADVMTYGAVRATVDTPYHDLVDTLEMRSVNAVPVVDSFDRVVGVVSASDLLHKIEFAGGVDPPRILESRRHRDDRRRSAGTVAADLMTAPAVTVSATATVTAAARLMESARVRRLPVVDDLGRLTGMVTNRDLLKVFLRPDDAIRRQILADVLPTVHGDGSAVVGVDVDNGMVRLTGTLDTRSAADGVAAGVAGIDGVVSVDNQLRYLSDDSVYTVS